MSKVDNDYMGITLKEPTHLATAEEIYAHFTMKLENGTLKPTLHYRIIEARLGTNYPPYWIITPENGFEPLDTEVVLQPLDPRDLTLIGRTELYPRDTIRDRFIKVARYHHYLTAYSTGDLKEAHFPSLWRQVAETQPDNEAAFIVKRAPRIADTEITKVLSWDWTRYLDDLLGMGAEKDPHITAAARSLLMPQFWEMKRLNSLSIWMTNPRTGKSVLSERLGGIVSRTTERSLTGGSNPDGRVVPSFLMRTRRPITLEQLEGKLQQDLLCYMLTALSGARSDVVVYQEGVDFEPYCPLILSGNPNRESGQFSLEIFFQFLQGITRNYAALGRRVGIILYGERYQTVKEGRALETMPEVDRMWAIWEEVSTRILPLYGRIFACEPVQRWLYTEDPEYRDAILGVFTDQPSLVANFFVEHARSAYPVIRFRALSGAVARQAQMLLRVHLEGGIVTEDTVTGVLATAEQEYRELRAINLSSVREIAQTTKLDKLILKALYEGLPRYIRELCVVVAHHCAAVPTDTLTLEALGGTFNEVREELGLYHHIGRVAQGLKEYSPEKHVGKLGQFGVTLVEKPEIQTWVVRVHDPRKLGLLIDVIRGLGGWAKNYPVTPAILRGAEAAPLTRLGGDAAEEKAEASQGQAKLEQGLKLGAEPGSIRAGIEAVRGAVWRFQEERGEWPTEEQLMQAVNMGHETFMRALEACLWDSSTGVYRLRSDPRRLGVTW